MPKINVYLPDPLAEAVRAHEIAVSPICQRALQQEVDRMTAQAKLTETMDRIPVELWAPNGEPYTASFVGTWLVPPDDDNRYSEADAGACYGIALTKRGRVAVYCYHVSGGWAPSLSDYDTLEAAGKDGQPGVLLAAAAGQVGDGFAVELDI
jgi:hypothetical protein